MKKYFIAWLAGAATVVIWGLWLIGRERRAAEASPDFGRFASVKPGMIPAEAVAALGAPSCAQARLQVERPEGTPCVPYRDQEAAGLTLVYLHREFIARVNFGSDGRLSAVETLVPPTTKVDPR